MSSGPVYSIDSAFVHSNFLICTYLAHHEPENSTNIIFISCWIMVRFMYIFVLRGLQTAALACIRSSKVFRCAKRFHSAGGFRELVLRKD